MYYLYSSLDNDSFSTALLYQARWGENGYAKKQVSLLNQALRSV